MTTFREWTNGVLTVAALEAVDEPSEVNTWIVCDGDIDPEWVESLNSVLGKILDLINWVTFSSSPFFYLPYKIDKTKRSQNVLKFVPFSIIFFWELNP